MKKLQLIMTSPCEKRWEEMKSTSQGRYCDHCEKHVVDLSNKTDEELVQFFQRKKENVCGRVDPDQLHRELVIPPKKASWPWLVPVMLGATVFTPAQATLVLSHQDPIARSPQPSSRSLTEKNAGTIIIMGEVLDDKSGKPLQQVKIKQQGYENVLATTDQHGKFQLTLNDQNRDNLFTFELRDYSRMECRVKDNMTIRLQPIVRVMLGGISTISTNRQPYYRLYSGKQSCSINAAQMKEISPEWIEHIEVVTGAKATATYGSKGQNGVVLIGIKKAYANKIKFSKEP